MANCTFFRLIWCCYCSFVALTNFPTPRIFAIRLPVLTIAFSAPILQSISSTLVLTKIFNGLHLLAALTELLWYTIIHVRVLQLLLHASGYSQYRRVTTLCR